MEKTQEDLDKMTLDELSEWYCGLDTQEQLAYLDMFNQTILEYHTVRGLLSE